MQTTKNFLKYAVLGGIFLTPFIAFLVPNLMFFPFISGKGFAFRILVEIISGLFVVLAFIDTQYRPKLSWVTKSVLLFTLAVLVADVLGVNPYKSLWSNFERMEGFVLIAHLALYYIVVSSVLKTKSVWNNFFNTTIFASLLMSIYGLLQIMGKITINQGGVRVDATFGNSTYLAIYLVFHIFLCLYLFVGDLKYKWLKWAYGLTALLEVVILYYTATRGAILGFIGGLLLTGLLIAWKERENKTLRKVAYGAIALVFVLVLGFVSLRNTSLVKNSPVLSRFSTLSSSEFKTQGRYFVWPMALQGIKENPVFGWGQENFNFVFNKYYNPGMFGQEEWFDRTHNIVLDWMIAGGLFGFLAYVSMYVALFYYIWRKENGLKQSEKSILTGMVAAYIFHNMFVFDNLISYILFFSVLSYVHFIGRSSSAETKSFYTKTFSAQTVNYVVAPIAVILTVAGVYFVNIPALRANQNLIQAMSPQGNDINKNLEIFNKIFELNSFGNSEVIEQLVSVTTQVLASQAPADVKQKFVDLSSKKLEEKIMDVPNDARYLVFYGSFLNHIGQYDQAVKYLERALVESPKKQTIFFELGTSYLGKRDFKKAMELFKTAYDLKPSSQEARVVYAIGALYAGDNAVLQSLSSQIDESVIISDNRFLKAYADIGNYDPVIAILTKRLEKDPTNMQYKLSLASAYATIKQKQKAIDILRDMIAQDPTFKVQGEEYIKQVQNS